MSISNSGLTRRFILGIALMSIGSVTLMIALIPLLLEYARPKPVTFQDLPWQVNNSPVPIGHPVVLIASICNITEEPVIVTSTISLIREVNERTQPIYLPSSVFAVLPGCHVFSNVSIRIPENVPTGLYHMNGISVVSGRLRTHYDDWSTTSFELVPAFSTTKLDFVLGEPSDYNRPNASVRRN